MTIPAKSTALLPLVKLPRTPVKKLGWRGMMKAWPSEGKILVTNHGEPEAVIIPVAEYEYLLRLAEQAGARPKRH